MTILNTIRAAITALLVGSIHLAAPTAGAQELPANILTGGPTGTYIQFGRDISEAAKGCGVSLTVNESAGSLENFLGVRKRRHTQFGIVQSDVLEYLKTFASDDPAVARAITGVRIALPLYNEEVHILARREISDFAALDGQKVSLGVEDSGTFLTASLMLDLAGIVPAEQVNLTADDSLAALKDGSIDAFFYVAGAPTKLFVEGDIDAARFHLLPIRDKTLQAVYLPTQIAADVYAFQQEPVDVVAVKAVLMTYDYDPGRNGYHRASCKVVSDITSVIVRAFPALREAGHPKWKQVDLEDLPPGWDVGNCVNTGLEPDYPLSCEAGGMVPPRSVAESTANSVYRKRICAAIGC